MGGRTVLTYHSLYDGRGFSPVTRSWARYRAFRELLERLGLAELVDTVEPALATTDDVLAVHTPEYVEHVARLDAQGTGFLDGKETPAWRGVLDRALAAVGATLEGARLVAAGEAAHVFNPSGGLHHAHRERAGGFCIYNDMVLAVRLLQRHGLSRVAVLDVDGHHGDGTQELLYGDPVLYLSLHQYDGRFFPGTGAVDEVGWAGGYGYTVNVPLPRRVGDGAYVPAFDAVVPDALRAYRPEAILLNFGVDGHHEDPLVRLGLTTATYRHIAAQAHRLAHELCGGRLLAFGSGGYAPDAVARCWSVLMAELAGQLPAGPGEWPGQLGVLAEEARPAPPGAVRRAAEAAVDQVRESVLPLRLAPG